MGGGQFAPEAWLPFFERMEATWVGTAVRESVWAFPIIEAVHLLGLGLLGGAVLLADLRLLGTGLTGRPIAEVTRQARPWLRAGVVTMFATGVPLFLSEAVKCYYNTSFWVKMIALPIALLYTFEARRRLVRTESTNADSPVSRSDSPDDPGHSREESGNSTDGPGDSTAGLGTPGLGRVTWRTRAVASVSLILWFTVAAAGRWIGFSG